MVRMRHNPPALSAPDTRCDITMSDDDRVFVPSYPYEAGPARGVLSPFEPGTRTLPAGYRIDPRFRSITTDIVLDKDVPVRLRDGVTIYVDVFRPVGTERCR